MKALYSASRPGRGVSEPNPSAACEGGAAAFPLFPPRTLVEGRSPGVGGGAGPRIPHGRLKSA
eukprot:scaffold5287_cov41-Tisochrysis_lutea.AAC.1